MQQASCKILRRRRRNTSSAHACCRHPCCRHPWTLWPLCHRPPCLQLFLRKVSDTSTRSQRIRHRRQCTLLPCTFGSLRCKLRPRRTRRTMDLRSLLEMWNRARHTLPSREWSSTTCCIRTESDAGESRARTRTRLVPEECLKLNLGTAQHTVVDL